MAFEDERAADEGWPTTEAKAGAMMRAGEIADQKLTVELLKGIFRALGGKV